MRTRSPGRSEAMVSRWFTRERPASMKRHSFLTLISLSLMRHLTSAIPAPSSPLNSFPMPMNMAFVVVPRSLERAGLSCSGSRGCDVICLLLLLFTALILCATGFFVVFRFSYEERYYLTLLKETGAFASFLQLRQSSVWLVLVATPSGVNGDFFKQFLPEFPAPPSTPSTKACRWFIVLLSD